MPTSEALRALCDEYWEWLLRSNPTFATFVGDRRYNDRFADISDAGRAARRKEAQGFLDRVRAIDATGLNENDAVTADVLGLMLQDAIDEDAHRFHQWAVDQMDGPQVDFPQLLNFHPPDDDAAILARFKAFPVYLDQYLDNLRQGVKEKRTAMRMAVDRVIGQLKALLATPPEKSAFARKPDYASAIEASVYPAYRKMLDFLEKEYRASSRERDVGLWALPGGEEAYRFRIRQHTTTTYSAQQLHDMGLEELSAIHEEMKKIGGSDLKAFLEKLKADPKNFYASREELLASAVREVERATAKLPDYFGRLPKTGCEVKPIEEYREKDSVAAFYYPPDEKLTRKGIFYANTYEPASRPKFNMPALAVHEAVPGHHLQIALAMEMEDLPTFRRQALAFTAYIEGWGLYTERLGDEMGMYEDDLSRFGMLTYQAWRACRLVVDTGIHALRWTREQSVQYFMDNVALTETEVLNEVDRYIIWPGQALAYMVGKREIMGLREEAKRAMGPGFDLKGFHDLVLRHGAIPLSTLRSLVEAWTKKK